MKNPIKSKKTAIAVLAAVATIGVATTAWAVFARTGETQAMNVSSETFTPLTVSGVWKGRFDTNTNSYAGTGLLPGDSGDVEITVENPAANTVPGKITLIEPVIPTFEQITGLADSNDRDDCLALLEFGTYANPSPAPVLADNGIPKSIILKNAVTLHPNATAMCSGMTFPTKFKVTFQATRDSVLDVASLPYDPAST